MFRAPSPVTSLQALRCPSLSLRLQALAVSETLPPSRTSRPASLRGLTVVPATLEAGPPVTCPLKRSIAP